jgi:hypothetical protein
MATDPKINLNVSTSDAVKNLSTLEGAAIESDTAIEKIDGSTVSVDTSATTRALQEVADKLERVDDKATKAGKQGIPVTTTAFKDLTEGIGGPASGAIGSAFKFGESIEGLGDLVEGFGGKLGLSEGQIGKVTTALGTTLGVLGAVGVAFTVGKAAYDLFTSGAKQAAKDQKEFNDAVDAAEKSLRGVAEALKEGDKARAFRDVAKDLEPILQNMATAGLNASDAILEITGSGKPFSDASRKRQDEINREIIALEELKLKDVSQAGEINNKIALLKDERTNLQEVTREIDARRLGVEGATAIDKLAYEALGTLNTTVQDNTEYYEKNTQKLEENRLKQLEMIGANRELELQLLDTKDALEGYDEKILKAEGDTDEIRRVTLETAGEVVEMAKAFGLLAGPEGSIENIKATREALTFMSGDLAPGSALRNNILGTVADLARIETGFVSGGPMTGAALAAREGGINAGYRSNTTINVTVTSADPTAVVKALQTYVRQNGSLPANLR